MGFNTSFFELVGNLQPFEFFPDKVKRLVLPRRFSTVAIVEQLSDFSGIRRGSSTMNIVSAFITGKPSAPMAVQTTALPMAMAS